MLRRRRLFVFFVLASSAPRLGMGSAVRRTSTLAVACWFCLFGAAVARGEDDPGGSQYALEWCEGKGRDTTLATLRKNWASIVRPGDPPYVELLDAFAEHQSRLLCEGMLQAFVSGYNMAVAMAKIPGAMKFCIPDKVKTSQLRKMLVVYLRAHPEFLHEDPQANYFRAFQPFVCFPESAIAPDPQ